MKHVRPPLEERSGEEYYAPSPLSFRGAERRGIWIPIHQGTRSLASLGMTAGRERRGIPRCYTDFSEEWPSGLRRRS